MCGLWPWGSIRADYVVARYSRARDLCVSESLEGPRTRRNGVRPHRTLGTNDLGSTERPPGDRGAGDLEYTW